MPFVSALLISSVWLAGITALSDTLISFAPWALEPAPSSLLDIFSAGSGATISLFPSASRDFSRGTPSVKFVTPAFIFSVLAVTGDTGKVSALTAPLAKNINAATATLATPKWYLRIE